MLNHNTLIQRNYTCGEQHKCINVNYAYIKVYVQHMWRTYWNDVDHFRWIRSLFMISYQEWHDSQQLDCQGRICMDEVQVTMIY